LDNHDVVIGPTYDGGYYLIGMNKYHDRLFQDIPWSTEKVYNRTIAKMKKNSLTYRALEILSDVDYEEDWQRWGWEL
jgi:glycosyltransferase A (GT-A) superfamily protein (DUF2064 family)